MGRPRHRRGVREPRRRSESRRHRLERQGGTCRRRRPARARPRRHRRRPRSRRRSRPIRSSPPTSPTSARRSSASPAPTPSCTWPRSRRRGCAPSETTFRTNIVSTYNVFEAARVLGLARVVWASSETILGLPFEREQPAYAPIDEEHPAVSGVELRALEAARRGARPPAAPLDGSAARRASLLEHHGAARLRALPDVLGRRAPAALEPLGLRRRARRRAELPARARRRRRRGALHRRGRATRS